MPLLLEDLAESARQAADYETGQVDEAIARNAVGEMQSFLAAIEPILKKVKT